MPFGGRSNIWNIFFESSVSKPQEIYVSLVVTLLRHPVSTLDLWGVRHSYGNFSGKKRTAKPPVSLAQGFQKQWERPYAESLPRGRTTSVPTIANCCQPLEAESALGRPSLNWALNSVSFQEAEAGKGTRTQSRAWFRHRHGHGLDHESEASSDDRNQFRNWHRKKMLCHYPFNIHIGRP